MVSHRRTHSLGRLLLLVAGFITAALSPPSHAFAADGSWRYIDTEQIPLRSGSSMTWDLLRSRAISFGGTVDGTTMSQTWTMGSGEGEWHYVPAANGGWPLTRAGAAVVWDPVRDRMVVFGGSTGDNYFDLHNDIWTLGGEDTPVWSQPPQARGPEPRMFTAAAYDPVRDRVLYFAGYPVHHARNQLWSVSLGDASLSYTQITPAGTAPNQRYGHTMTYDSSRDRMIVFGGHSGPYLNELWALSLTGNGQWTRLVGPGAPPPGRAFHTAIYDPIGDRLIVAGGEGQWDKYFSDTWEYRFNGKGWREMDTESDPVPAATVGVYDPHLHRILMLSQHDANGPRRGTWSLDLAGQTTDVPGVREGSVTVLEGALPNPAFAAPRIALSLPDGAAATLELLDLAGRRVRSRNVGALGMGRHVVDLGAEGHLAPGLYFARLTRGTETLTAKICVAR